MSDFKVTLGPTDAETASRLYRDVRELGVRSEMVDIEEVGVDE